MTWTPTTITILDGDGEPIKVVAYTDGTNFAFANPILDNAGAVVNPATAGKQDTAITALQSIVTNTIRADPAATIGSITAADSASTVTTGAGGQSLVTGAPTANSFVTVALNGCSSFALELSGTWAGTVQFERSVDGGVNFVPIGLGIVGASTGANSATGNGVFHGNASSTTHIRIRCTAFTSGSIGVRVQPGIGDGTVFAALMPGSATIGSVSAAANTLGGASTYSATGTPGNALLTNSPVAVKASAGNLYGIDFVNTGNAPAYVQFFDALIGSVTLGTTPPKLSKWVPAGGSWEEKFTDEAKIGFSTAITVAATSGPANNAAPASAVLANIIFK